MSETIEIEKLRTWIGRSQRTEDIATEAKSRGLAATLDYPEDPWSGTLFPLAHWTHFNPQAPASEIGSDGHPRLGGFLPPVPLPRRMWAGSTLTFHAPIRIGAQLSDTATVTDVAHRTGRSGELVFVTVTHEIHADGQLATTDEHQIVYRAAAEVTRAPEQTPEERTALGVADTTDWDYARVLAPNAVDLFRYSALTFNAHRIHYDRDYCRDVEGYPGLVVHGPLSATHLVDAFMREHPGVTVRGFSFTARKAAYDGTQIAYAGRRTAAGTTEVAALDPAGDICLRGTITHDPLDPAASPAASSPAASEHGSNAPAQAGTGEEGSA